MKTNAPKSVTWIIATIAGVAGILGEFNLVNGLGEYSLWLLTGGFVLLSLSSLMKDL